MVALHYRFSKPCWTDKELKVATGSTGSEVAVHPLKLNSSYSTVKVLLDSLLHQ